MRVIFLDFDGVMVLPNGGFCPTAIQLLNQLHTETGAGIVFSTSWKMAHETSQLAYILRSKGLNRNIPIHGSTPNLLKLSSEDGIVVVGTRGQEITAWLEGNPVESYVVIDDDIPQCWPHLERCVETTLSFTECDYKRALEILMAPVPDELDIF